MIVPVQMVFGFQLPAASATLYYAAGSIKIAAVTFTNITAAPVIISVQTSHAGGASFTIIDGVSIAAHSTYLAPELTGLVLMARDSLFAQAGMVNSVNAYLNGVSFP